MEAAKIVVDQEEVQRLMQAWDPLTEPVKEPLTDPLKDPLKEPLGIP